MIGKSPALVSAFGRVARIVAVACSLSLASVSFAADDDTIIVPGASRAESGAKTGGASLNTVSLFLGVVLAGVGGWMVWRNRRGVPMAREVRSLAIDETRSLGNRQYLVVASYEGKKFLIGVCPGRIDLLSPLDGSPANARSHE